MEEIRSRRRRYKRDYDQIARFAPEFKDAYDLEEFIWYYVIVIALLTIYHHLYFYYNYLSFENV